MGAAILDFSKILHDIVDILAWKLHRNPIQNNFHGLFSWVLKWSCSEARSYDKLLTSVHNSEVDIISYLRVSFLYGVLSAEIRDPLGS